MEITSVRVTRFNQNSVVGLATITLDNELVVTKIRIVKNQNGLFVSLPSYKNNNGEYNEIVYPITKEMREKISNAILDEYIGR